MNVDHTSSALCARCFRGIQREEGVKIAATLREDGVNRIKISVRAVPGYDATKVTVIFGGGGHKGAAGGSSSLPLQEAAKAVEEAMLEQ